MPYDYTVYAWRWSHFAAKLRGFLNYKKIEYREKTINFYDLAVRLPRKTGATAMPAIELRNGEWLSDTPLIIEELDRRHPERICQAQTPRQRILELLIENWFDDGWMAVSGQTRWAYCENWDDGLRDESARALLPGFPLVFSRPLADRIFKANMLRGLIAIGARPHGQDKQLETWALGILDTLERHLDTYPYLFGGHPTRADFAVLGSLAGHLTRDPWPRREWMASRPRLLEWTERLHAGEGHYGSLAPDDIVPQTLQPLIDLMLAEFPILLDQTAKAIEERVADKGLKSGETLPRVEREVAYPMDGADFRRNPFTYSVWRMQRIQKVYRAFGPLERASVDAFFETTACPEFLDREYGPNLSRSGLGTKLA
ncbi:MAG: glutathione S-transferase family protein [Pseudomonadota bacterium]